MQKISPFLWFDHQAEEAAKYYVEVFNSNPGKKTESKIGVVTHYDKACEQVSGQKEGTVMTVGFTLEGAEFAALNGGSHFKFSGAISFVVDCKTQAEVDHFWQKLGDGGETGQCGWINHDKFGVTWQIVPSILTELLSGDDSAGAERAMKAMLSMTKLDIAALKKAYDGK